MASRPHLPAYSLNFLRVFDTVAQYESIKRAADELCLTPSAVSQQIKVLEDQLGVALFTREPARLLLTDAGRQYAADIKPLLAALDGATQRLRESHRAQRNLRVSLMPPLANRIVFPALAELRQQYPGLRLQIDASIKDVDLLRRTADLALRLGSPPWHGCVHEKLIDIYIQPVCSPKLAQDCKLDVAHPEALLQAPKVHMLARPDAWTQYLEGLGLKLDTTEAKAHDIYVDDYPTAIDSGVAVGVSLAVMPVERALIDSGHVCAVGPALGPLPGGLYAVMLPEWEHDPAISQFLSWLRGQLESL